MTQIGSPQHDPIPIGDIAKPPFARLPDPLTIFARRAGRLRSLADGNALRSYFIFLADLADIQHRLQDGLPEGEVTAADTIVRAGQFGTPPLDRSAFRRDHAFDEAWHQLLALAGDMAMPESARLALDRVKAAGTVADAELISGVLSNAIPGDALAEHVFVAAVLQVHFARLAAQLNVNALRPVSQGACPVCGAPPISSLVVGWHDAHATRFCACSLWARYGITHASSARCAARPRKLPTKRLPADPARSKPRPADPATVTSRYWSSGKMLRSIRSPMTSQLSPLISCWAIPSFGAALSISSCSVIEGPR
jgi:FdhE protein